MYIQVVSLFCSRYKQLTERGKEHLLLNLARWGLCDVQQLHNDSKYHTVSHRCSRTQLLHTLLSVLIIIQIELHVTRYAQDITTDTGHAHTIFRRICPLLRT